MLFERIRLGEVELRNRFVRAATYEAMGTQAGGVTEGILEHYRRLARGEVGLIITGHVYVHPLGKAARYQLGIYDDSLIPGLKRLTQVVHREGARVLIQIAHAGRQTNASLIGQKPLAPSSRGRDPVYFVKPQAMDENQIWAAIEAFGDGAERAVKAGADGVQIHAAHGYLINQFLSPYFNVRRDAWGGTAERRFRFLREVVLEAKKRVPNRVPVSVKLNTYDATPEEGITSELAAEYTGWLSDLGIDALEVSRGATLYAPFEMCRGDIPVSGLVQRMPWWQRPMARWMMGRWVGQHGFEGPYNLDAAKKIKPHLGSLPLILTGGVREVSEMERILQSGVADMIGMSRPFVREPALVRRIRLGRTDAASCVSCNRCFAAIASDIPLRCYYTGLPE